MTADIRRVPLVPTAPRAPKALPAQRHLPLADEARAVDRVWRPNYAVWEITLRWDLACHHCGSRAGKARPTSGTLSSSNSHDACLSTSMQRGYHRGTTSFVSTAARGTNLAGRSTMASPKTKLEGKPSAGVLVREALAKPSAAPRARGLLMGVVALVALQAACSSKVNEPEGDLTTKSFKGIYRFDSTTEAWPYSVVAFEDDRFSAQASCAAAASCPPRENGTFTVEGRDLVLHAAGVAAVRRLEIASFVTVGDAANGSAHGSTTSLPVRSLAFPRDEGSPSSQGFSGPGSDLAQSARDLVREQCTDLQLTTSNAADGDSAVTGALLAGSRSDDNSLLTSCADGLLRNAPGTILALLSPGSAASSSGAAQAPPVQGENVAFVPVVVGGVEVGGPLLLAIGALVLKYGWDQCITQDSECQRAVYLAVEDSGNKLHLAVDQVGQFLEQIQGSLASSQGYLLSATGGSLLGAVFSSSNVHWSQLLQNAKPEGYCREVQLVSLDLNKPVLRILYFDLAGGGFTGAVALAVARDARDAAFGMGKRRFTINGPIAADECNGAVRVLASDDGVSFRQIFPTGG